MNWMEVNSAVETLTDALSEPAKDIQSAIRTLPYWKGAGAYINTVDNRLWMTAEDEDNAQVAQWLKKADVHPDVLTNVSPPYYLEDLDWIKVAYSPLIRDTTEAMNLTPGDTFGIPNSPSPLASMLTSGALGAGVGYGLGYLGEKALPNNWRRGKLRKSLAVAGGLAGATPGFLWGLANTGILGRDFNDPFLLDSAPTGPSGTPKQASADFGASGARMTPVIPVDAFNRIVWHDPDVAGRLDLPEQVALTSLVGGAAKRTGNPFVTPADVGMIAAGMGSGYMSGWAVGKILGGLIGAPQETQDKLKQVGMWAGIAKNVIPIAFGG